ncbi:hypothetical protein [Flavobacterium sp.]|uniref:hypothetical protein n=1 Tax=Flavobacterium sp. TaxID=239 RepID=UPI0011F805E0|nr:hypothetical protein [Flavobacterium sp.]RZJ71084.1 MAG: hypothetical protein EOO49_11565 [Flavobacterium sp.]
MNPIKKIVRLTVPQIRAFANVRKNNYWIWGRGSGKSTALAYAMREFCKRLPGASIALVGATYSQILSRTLPSTIEGLSHFGLYQDVDFVVGQSGKKKGYKMPFQPPNQWNNVMHFSSGTIFQLVSLDNPNSGRGLNAYGEVGDEALTLDPEKLYNNVKTTNRSRKAIFNNDVFEGAAFYASSMPVTKRGKWILEMKKKAEGNPEEFYYSQANAFWNPHLQPSWFKRMEDESPSRVIYEAEILNIEPKEITDGFYANLNPDHYYTDFANSYLESINMTGLVDLNGKRLSLTCRQDNDLRVDVGLTVSIDFGVFNSLTVSQPDDLLYKVLKSMWVKSPKLLDDLFIEQFIPYYEPHKTKIVYLYGGHDGNMRGPNHKLTLFEQVRDLLKKHGWTVYIMAKGAAASHADKYLLINAMLKGTYPNLPKIRINEHNNPDLIVSLEHAEAIEGRNGVEKDKRPERNKSMKQEHTTHLSDAFDHPIFALYWDKFKGRSNKHLAENGISVG